MFFSALRFIRRLKVCGCVRACVCILIYTGKCFTIYVKMHENAFGGVRPDQLREITEIRQIS